jgi:two-component system LytT family response regulator
VVHILESEPDLVFLDVCMPEGGGFDVIERVGTARMPEVVFVTAHEHFTLRAFEVHALDYVMKPCEPQRIRDALAHARERLRRSPEGMRVRLDALLESLETMERDGPRPRPRRITVRDGDGIRFVDVADIEWIQADDGDVLVHAGRDVHRIPVALRHLLGHLGPGRFVRIHRSAAVNLDHVSAVRPWGHGDHVAVLASGRELRVSRTYREALFRPVH